MSEIRVLSKEVSELIAAGEVIDRPAAVIKELLENSIDAGASVITVEIQNGGRTYMRVTDNGKGFAAEDLPIAFLRHATSKVWDKNDLDNIMTLGFRGEALASICAVAKVDVLTKRLEDNYGIHYVIEGAAEQLSERCGCPDGTTFVVRDIFYNVPARLKFLKKDASEGHRVTELVTKLTLSHPEISFKLIKDGKTELLTAGDGKIYSAVYSVFGRELAAGMIEVDYSYEGMHIYGYTVKPLEARPNRRFQNFFVNKRYVRSAVCAAALEEAYRNNIMVGKFPACVIYIDTPPNTIDVNVHPTKTEVRFSDENLVHEAVFYAVKNALTERDEPRRMTLGKERNFTDRELFDIPKEDKSEQLEFDVVQEPPMPDDVIKAIESLPPLGAPDPRPPAVTKIENTPIPPEERRAGTDQFLATLGGPDTAAPASEPEPAEEPAHEEPPAPPPKVTIDAINRALTEIPMAEDEPSGPQDFRFINKGSFIRSVVSDRPRVPSKGKPVVIGELFKTYVVAQIGDEMILMDKHAAHERFIFEKIKNDARELETQLLLEPIMVLLSYEEFDALAANVDKVAVLGFEIEPDVAPTVAVKGVPTILGDRDPTEAVTELAENFVRHKHDPQLEIFDDLYHSLACKAAIKANDDNSLVELQALLNAVYDNNDTRYCPHGRPVLITLTRKDIERQFRRLV